MPSGEARMVSELPDIDDRLVVPETRYEMIDGELVFVSPADHSHGERHARLAILLGLYIGPGFNLAVDMLTRTSLIDDFAPDVSVYPSAPDPETGHRQLPQLAFEIVSTQPLRAAARKAAKLAARGVRRVFAVHVLRSRVLEWSTTHAGWTRLDPADVIDDPAFVAPLPIKALIRNVPPDDAVARALLTKRNPVIERERRRDRIEGKIEGKVEGQIEGAIRSLLAVLATRGIALDHAICARIRREQDLQRLDRWIVRAVTAATITDVLGDD